MAEHNITVQGGSSVRLKTAGKYCDRDIVVTAEGGGLETCEVTVSEDYGVDVIFYYTNGSGEFVSDIIGSYSTKNITVAKNTMVLFHSGSWLFCWGDIVGTVVNQGECYFVAVYFTGDSSITVANG